MDKAVLALLLAAVVIAAEPAPQDEMAASPAQVAVGDTLVVTISYRWPHGWTVAEPDPAAAFVGQFVTAAPPCVRSGSGEEERRSFRYTLVAVRSGAWALPRPSFSATGPNGAVEAKAPEVIVQVGTEAKPPQLPAARPLLIRPPPSLASVSRWWWSLLGLVPLLAAAAWWSLRRSGVVGAGPTPWQVFAAELAASRQGGDGKEVGARISLALRRYAGAVWVFDGTGQTTREVAATMRRLGAAVPDDESRELLRLLGRLDELRWMAGELPAETMLDLVTVANAWAEGVQKRLDAEAAAAKVAGKAPA